MGPRVGTRFGVATPRAVLVGWLVIPTRGSPPGQTLGNCQHGAGAKRRACACRASRVAPRCRPSPPPRPVPPRPHPTPASSARVCAHASGRRAVAVPHTFPHAPEQPAGSHNDLVAVSQVLRGVPAARAWPRGTRPSPRCHAPPTHPPFLTAWPTVHRTMCLTQPTTVPAGRCGRGGAERRDGDGSHARGVLLSQPRPPLPSCPHSVAHSP